MKENNYQRWFVADYYIVAGRPKLEAALMDYAIKRFMYCLVYEDQLKDMVSNIKAKQEQLYEANRRLRKVEIKIGFRYQEDKHTRIYIGAENIFLRKVRDELECIDPNFPQCVDNIKIL